MALVRCPQAAASKVATAERVQIGWTRAGEVVLPARADLCFRCLEHGHVRERCRNIADRSDTCYRCGNPGHRARDCRAVSAKCAVCAERGGPSDHKVGGLACKPPRNLGWKGKRRNAGEERTREGTGASTPATAKDSQGRKEETRPVSPPLKDPVRK
ncbi:cellular nucleic acid-binding protein-like [Harpegnathos saltator]|uniref:cellular nucleic acid-binding protein-like n=1 Tax=Harpegnathos saltator TaxID=610380 RepID=UPI00094894ED|nr:cellular nucleic acid-binding protein-like [Harpegnathos saltator]